MRLVTRIARAIGVFCIGIGVSHAQVAWKGDGAFRDSRDFAYSEWSLRDSRFGVPLDLRIVRTRRYKLTLEGNSGAGEMYDLRDDPHEMVNIYDDPLHAAVQNRLKQMIASRPADERSSALPQVGMA